MENLWNHVSPLKRSTAFTIFTTIPITPTPVEIPINMQTLLSKLPNIVSEEKLAEADLEKYFFWLLVFTFIVLLGVLFEESESAPIRKYTLDARTGMPRPRVSAIRLTHALTRLGWLMIVIGVLGELIFEGFEWGAGQRLKKLNDDSAIEMQRLNLERDKQLLAEIRVQGPRSRLIAEHVPIFAEHML
jgi:hypothetical protein